MSFWNVFLRKPGMSDPFIAKSQAVHKDNSHHWKKKSSNSAKPVFTCTKLTIEKIDPGVIYIQS